MLPLILVHGLGGPLMWQRLAPLVERERRVERIELPGFGSAPAPPFPMSPEDHADFIADRLDDLRIDCVHIAGISYGGQVAAAFAARHARRIANLVLICPAGLTPDRFIAANAAAWNIFSRLTESTVLQSQPLMCLFGARSFYDVKTRPPELCGYFYKQLSRPGGRAAWLASFRETSRNRTKFTETLNRIQSPALIVWGQNDRIIPLRYAEQFASAIPNSRVETLPRCGHSIPLEQPEQLNSILQNFLAGKP